MTKEEFEKINPRETLVIDLREDDELAVAPSPVGAVHVPTALMMEKVENEILPKDKKIITLCHSGGRCQIVTKLLQDHGYKADYLEGGIRALSKG